MISKKAHSYQGTLVKDKEKILKKQSEGEIDYAQGKQTLGTLIQSNMDFRKHWNSTFKMQKVTDKPNFL